MGHRAATWPPEGLLFLDEEKSPNGEPLLLAACEVSGTVAVYQMGDEALTVLPFADVEEGKSGTWMPCSTPLRTA